jgi:hypothetical protein
MRAHTYKFFLSRPGQADKLNSSLVRTYGFGTKPCESIIMAIYSLHHSSIGKSTQSAPYTAGAHVNYITRESAASRCEARRMPATREKAASFFRQREDAMRKNARVADKLMLALPRELDAEERVTLVRDFAEAVTEGRASWFAAFHDKGKDKQNPHCHLIICDRDIETGRRVFGMSEKGSTERLRALWEEHANTALARAGRRERIDRRTLEAQGISRRPTIHVGVRSRQLIGKNWLPASRERIVSNHCQARSRARTISYPVIDEGKLRLAHNIQIRRSNMFESRAAHTEQDYWEAIDEDAFIRDIRELRRLNAVLEFGPDGVTPQRSRERDIGGLDL